MRVFGKSSYFSNVFRDALDENSGMMMNFMAAHRWLAVRIQMLGACSVLFSVAFVASFNDVLNLVRLDVVCRPLFVFSSHILLRRNSLRTPELPRY